MIDYVSSVALWGQYAWVCVWMIDHVSSVALWGQYVWVCVDD